ncbi:hypothetical protein [Desulfonema magnum]|uniref:Immunoglobulin-like fold-containing n=1 Tax=Desulfonema magnum TaxID=45655 RepID=A0A975BY03_9BACT|nr:hypothetical protein [Desulfonema magnum]QTA93921.1 immunoglobulin-like fold-containing [Desulfonema magnum]
MNKIKSKIVSAQVVFLAALILFPMPLCAQNNGSISGTVYQSDGITPFTENVIYIEAIPGDVPCGDLDTIGSAYTNSSDGTYRIENLPPGTYHLRTSIPEKINYANEWWASSESVTDCNLAQSVTLGDGASVSDKNFQLDAGAMISGTIYQSDGVTPFTGDSIYIDVISDEACGRKSAGWTQTNSSDGTYTVVGLPPGTYYLLTSISELNYVNEWWAESASVTDCDNAENLTVQAGEAVTGRNFQLDPGAAISGTIYQNDGVTPFTGASVYTDVVSGDPCGDWKTIRYTYTNSSDGTYTVVGLPPGTYFLLTSVMGPDYVDEWWAEKESVMLCSHAGSVTVEAAGVSVINKDFQLAYEATISGTVCQNDGVTRLTQAGISIQVISGDPCGDWNVDRSVSADASDGTYSITQLTPGTYYLRASVSAINYVDEWWAESASMSDCNLARPVTVAPGDSAIDKAFQLAPEATISGTVYQSDGVTPFTEEGTSVAVISGNPCGDWKKIASASVDTSDGTYVIGGLPGGIYYLHTLISKTDYADEWWAESASVTECAKAQSVMAESGTTVRERNFQIATLTKGDMNGDGHIRLDDAILALKAISGLQAIGIYSDANADGDGKIGLAEISYILRDISKHQNKMNPN